MLLLSLVTLALVALALVALVLEVVGWSLVRRARHLRTAMAEVFQTADCKHLESEACKKGNMEESLGLTSLF